MKKLLLAALLLLPCAALADSFEQALAAASWVTGPCADRGNVLKILQDQLAKTNSRIADVTAARHAAGCLPTLTDKDKPHCVALDSALLNGQDMIRQTQLSIDGFKASHLQCLKSEFAQQAKTNVQLCATLRKQWDVTADLVPAWALTLIANPGSAGVFAVSVKTLKVVRDEMSNLGCPNTPRI